MPGGPSLDEQLCFALYAATNAVTRAYRPLLGAIGLTYPQYLVMMVLWQDGASTIQTIARRLRLGANAITPLIDRLEAAGLVARGQSTTDRRVVRAILTPAGEALRDEVSKAQDSVKCQMSLSSESVAALRAELMALTDRMAPAASVNTHSITAD